MRSASRLVLLLVAPLVLTALAGCDRLRDRAGGAPGLDATATRPMPRPLAGGTLPGAGAATVDEFDTTTAAERAAAVAKPVGGTKLGRSVATLGNPADPGFWLETPLVDAVGPGRVVSAVSGKSVQVELRPVDAEPGAGSRISLPALRLLDVGLSGLHEIDVFAG